MAKSVKEDGTARVDPSKAKAYVKRIEQLEADIKSAGGQHANEVKQIREDIKEVYAEAASKGISTKGLKATIKVRTLDRKKKEIEAGLEDTDSEAFDQIRLALGMLADTPLGKAAAAADKKKADKETKASADALSKVGKGPEAAKAEASAKPPHDAKSPPDLPPAKTSAAVEAVKQKALEGAAA